MKVAVSALLFLSALIGAAGARDELQELKADLSKQWTSATISLRIEQGCIPPLYLGIQLRRGADGVKMRPEVRGVRAN